MPRAVASRETQKFDLDTVEDGYVVLRRMDYGQQLMAQDESIQAITRDRRKRNGSGPSENVNEVEMKLISSTATARAFAACIVDHNLEDDQGRKLDFTNPSDVFLLELNVANEINEKINDLNKVRDLGNLPSISGTPSPTG